MSHDVTFIPASTELREAPDFVYREQSSRERALYVLMQDPSPRPGAARSRFLRACFRHAVARYLDAGRPLAAGAFLRECAGAFDAASRAVDTRLDDFEELGMVVAVREPESVHVLCTRSAPARLRWRGVFVPFATPDVEGVTELPIETTRAQHDLFAQTLPETLALYRIEAAQDDAGRELLLGGGAADLAHAIDLAAQPRAADARRVASDHLHHVVLMLTVPSLPREAATGAVKTRPGAGRPRRPPRVAVIGVASVLVVVGAIAGIGVWHDAGPPAGNRDVSHSASKETTAPPEPQRRVTADIEAAEQRAAARAETPTFGVAWQESFRGAVTSSPAVAGDAVVFGARDGRVYSMHRGTGEKQWTYAAQGGVGASPVVRGGHVIVADYGGNVVRLRAGDGAVEWKRALGEKIVSTPAVTGERVLVGTTKGRVYALSLDTGRVLWKFATRGPVRGSIAHAGGTFLVPSNDGKLYALAEETGGRRWVLSAGGPVASSPASDGEIVVVGTARGEVVAVDLAKGKPRWKYRTSGAVNSSLALVDGLVYAGSADHRLYCIDAASGDLRWRFDTGGTILSRPFVGDGRVMVTSYDGAVYCLDADSGELVDRYGTNESIFSSPVVVDGRVFFGNNAGRFYCLSAPQS